MDIEKRPDSALYKFCTYLLTFLLTYTNSNGDLTMRT